jgi:hypothetical protein
MKIPRRHLIVGSAAVLACRPAMAETPLKDALARVASARAGLRTLSGPFQQTRKIGLLASEVRSTGTLVLARPDRLRWELAPPDAITFWIGPEGLAYRSLHGSGKMPSTNSGVGAVLEDLRTLLAGDLSGLDARWSLRLVRQDESGLEFEATGRADASANVRSIRLALAPDLVRPTHVLLVEGPHDQTAIDFGDLRVNAPVDGSSLRPPE